MYLKVMSGENIPDDDPRKCYRLIDGVEGVTFDRNTCGKLIVNAELFDGATLTFIASGNVYVLDYDGNAIESMGAGEYHEQPEEPDTLRDLVKETLGIDPGPTFVFKMADMKHVRGTLDMLAIRLAGHDHHWLTVDRDAYDNAVRIINEQIGEGDGEESMHNRALRVIKNYGGTDDALCAALRWRDDDVTLFWNLISPEEGMTPMQAYTEVESRRRGGR